MDHRFAEQQAKLTLISYWSSIFDGTCVLGAMLLFVLEAISSQSVFCDNTSFSAAMTDSHVVGTMAICVGVGVCAMVQEVSWYDRERFLVFFAAGVLDLAILLTLGIPSLSWVMVLTSKLKVLVTLHGANLKPYKVLHDTFDPRLAFGAFALGLLSLLPGTAMGQQLEVSLGLRPDVAVQGEECPAALGEAPESSSLLVGSTCNHCLLLALLLYLLNAAQCSAKIVVRCYQRQHLGDGGEAMVGKGAVSAARKAVRDTRQVMGSEDGQTRSRAGSSNADVKAVTLVTALCALSDNLTFEPNDMRGFAILVVNAVTMGSYWVLAQLFGTADWQSHSAAHLVCMRIVYFGLMLTAISNKNRLMRTDAEVSSSNLAARRHLIKHVSHEIRTPLNVISMGVDLLDRSIEEALEAASAATQREAHTLIEELRKSCDNAAAIIDDLACFQGTDTFSLGEREGVGALKLLRDTVLLVPNGQEKPKFHIKHPSTLAVGPTSPTGITDNADPAHVDFVPIVYVDRKLLEKALRNVLQIAAKYSEQSSYAPSDTPAGRAQSSSALGADVSITVSMTNVTPTSVAAETTAGAASGLNAKFRYTGVLSIQVAYNGVGLSRRSMETLAFMMTDRSNSTKVPAQYYAESNAVEAKIGLVTARNILHKHDFSISMRTVEVADPAARASRGSFAEAGQSPEKLCTTVTMEMVAWLDPLPEPVEPRHELPVAVKAGQANQADNGIAGSSHSTVSTNVGGSSGSSSSSSSSSASVTSAASADGREVGSASDRTALDIAGKGEDREVETKPSSGRSSAMDPNNDSSLALREDLHVLVVDDVALNRKFARRLMEKMKHTVEEADDGDTCVERVLESATSAVADGGKAGKSVNLVLLDNTMPRMKGRDAVRILRERGCNLPIIGITGDQGADLQDFLEQGADVVLVKPVSYKKIMVAVQQAIDRGRVL